VEEKISRRIALIGMPRSGTTWTAKAIDSQSRVYYLHEPDSTRRMSIPHVVTDDEVHAYTAAQEQYLSTIDSVRNLKSVGRLPFFPKSFQYGWQTRLNSMTIAAFKIASKVSGHVADLNVPILDRPKESRVLFWKSIESCARLNVLAEAAPDDRFVFLMRHPCGIANSVLRGIKQNRFSSAVPIYENIGVFEQLLKIDTAKELQLTLTDIEKMSIAQRLGIRWLLYCEKAVRDIERYDNITLSVYENVCQNPLVEFERMRNFFELEKSNTIERYVSETTGSHDRGFYSIRKDPSVSAEKWRRELQPEFIKEIETVIKGSDSAAVFGI